MIYRLKVVRFASEYKYPEFKVYGAEIYYFLSKEEAEAKIRDTDWSIGWDSGVWCFTIEVCPTGRQVLHEVYRRWLYDGTGSFVAVTLCSELNKPGTCEQEEPYPGRRPEQCLFRPGDIVEVWKGDTVSLGIVYELPPLPDEGLRIWTEDWMEDNYITLHGEVDKSKFSLYLATHDHAYVSRVLAPAQPVPDKYRRRLKRLLKAVDFEIEVTNFDATMVSAEGTGLDRPVWILSKRSSAEPVVVIQLNHNYALTMSVGPEPEHLYGPIVLLGAKEYKNVRAWIALNHEIIQKHWENPDSVALCYGIKQLKQKNRI